jgi:hypothetical protein
MWGSLEKIHLQRLLPQEVLQLMDLPANSTAIGEFVRSYADGECK